MSEDNNKSEKKIYVFPFIKGEVIDLVAGNSEWANLQCKWSNDPNVRHYDRNLWPVSLEDIKKFFEPAPDRHIRDFVFLTIYHKNDNRPIGIVGLENINWASRNANIFATIGEPEYWGKGITTEASKLLIEYGFAELNLHKIYAGVYTPNKRSLRVIEKLGFKKETVLKEEVYVDGVYHDTHKYALFKRDWIKSSQKES